MKNTQPKPIKMEDKIKNPIKSSDEDKSHSMMEFIFQDKEQLFSGIINNAGAAVYLKDLKRRYIFVNKEFEDLLQITQKDVIGRTDFDIFPIEIAENLIVNDKKVLDTGQIQEIEEQVPIDKNIRTYLSVKFTVSNKEGKFFGIAGISTDITLRVWRQPNVYRLS